MSAVTPAVVVVDPLMSLSPSPSPPTTSISTSSTSNSNNNRSSSSSFFLLASVVGSAAGFGNIWRFPSLIYKYGINSGSGIVFMIPYFLGLLFIGIPLVVNELVLSSHLQTGNEINIHHYLNKHTKGIGIGCVFSGLIVSTYYITLISWCIHVLMITLGVRIGGVLQNAVYLALTWILVGFGLLWNVYKHNNNHKNRNVIWYYMTMTTTGIPIIMLLIILIRSLTLPGAYSNDYGIKKYFSLADIQWNDLSSVLINQPDIWSIAIAQIFFSIGITFGVLTVFGSRMQQNNLSSTSTSTSPAVIINSGVVENSFLIVFINTVFSLLSGISAMAVIGYTTQEIGNNFRPNTTGPAFLLDVYPAALATLPGGTYWSQFFYLTLILVGLNSSFALLEGITTMAMPLTTADSSASSASSFTTKQVTVIIGICTIGFLSGMIFTSYKMIDTIDFYMNYIVLFLGFCKSINTGWIYNMKQQVHNLHGKWNIVYMYLGTTFCSFLFASLVWFGVKGNTFWLGLFSLIVIYGSGICYCLYNLQNLINEDNSISMKFLRNELLMGNILELRTELSSSGVVDGTNNGYHNLPWILAFLMKHFIPQALLVLFINLFFEQTEYGNIEFGNYNQYQTWPYQVVGVSTVLFVMGMVFIGVLNSKIYDFLITDPSLLKKIRTGTGLIDEEVGDDDDDDYDVEMKDRRTNDNYNQGIGESNFDYLYMENLEKQSSSEKKMNATNTTTTAIVGDGYGEDTTTHKATDGVLA